MSVRPVVHLHTIMQLRVALTVDNLGGGSVADHPHNTYWSTLETEEKISMKIYLFIYLFVRISCSLVCRLLGDEGTIFCPFLILILSEVRRKNLDEFVHMFLKYYF